MDIAKLQAELAGILHDTTLTDDRKLAQRAGALDFLAFLLEFLRVQDHHTLGSVDMYSAPTSNALQMMHTSHPWAVTCQRLLVHQTVLQQAIQLQTHLETLNRQLFQQIRSAIQSGALTGDALRRCLNQFTDYRQPESELLYMSYDGLDVLVDGLFRLSEAPAPTLAPVMDRVHCEETPARLLLELVDRITFAPTDLFYDLGSGLGQVAMLVHLLTGVKAKGIEVEPAFCAFARRQTHDLGLTQVTFINADASNMAYSDGTHFFMFTPFRGQILQSVLNSLYHEAQHRSIYLCTFGSCTPHVADQHWLRPLTADARHEYKLAIFESLP